MSNQQQMTLKEFLAITLFGVPFVAIFYSCATAVSNPSVHSSFYTHASTPAPTYQPSGSLQSYPDTPRNREIDRFVDSQIDTSWRPLPGGNSKEDAAAVTKDILKARSFEELDQVIKYHTEHGR